MSGPTRADQTPARRIPRLAVAAAASLVLAGAASRRASAQEVRPGPEVAQLRLLRAANALREADTALARVRYLRERRLASREEEDARASARDRARLELLEQWIGAAGAMGHLQIVSARKARTRDGRTMVRLRLLPALPAFAERSVVEAALGAALPGGRAGAVAGTMFVSVKDEAGPSGAAIGVPYEARLEFGAQGAAQEVAFRLLRDADAVVVAVTSGDRVEERKVWLESDRSGSIALMPRQFSQEADLGTPASYEVTVERFGDDALPLRIVALGVPPTVAASVVDAESGARIAQLRLTPEQPSRRLRLVLALPADAGGGVAVDSALRVHLAAAPAPVAARLLASGADADAWRRAGAGVAALELVPRGVGRLELRAFNLFQDVEQGTPVTVRVALRNAGSRPLSGVRLSGDALPGWELRTLDTIADPLAAGADRTLRLTIAPPPGAELGDYEIALRAEADAGRQQLTSDPVTYRLHYRARASWTTTGLLLVALAAALALAVVATRRLAVR